MSAKRLPVDALLVFCASDARLEPVDADARYARQIVESVAASECDVALYAVQKDNWVKANTLTYDAARKSMEALLLSLGWRVRNVPGAHAAVGAAATAWLADAAEPAPRIALRFNASRIARHDDEYPSSRARTRTGPELRDLVADNVRLMNLARVTLGLRAREDLVPAAPEEQPRA